MKQSSNSDVSNWQVPAFTVDLWEQRKKQYCIVIPVINEGTRITKLLGTMLSLGIPNVADVIIVDGGSTDGSLDANTLHAEYGVAALLTKTGPGKLSAQLRCAYSFCLKNEYTGIITIDGNNKDDPKAIYDFIAALDNGMDFVQGSRFIPGGKAENTPLIRYLAIRGIHAPVLRLFSGHNWTDTTQGFRAYSRKLLLDADLSIFRETFMDYELLAYMSYRAPRLGYNCIELPTSRSYPDGEIPTKISSIRGNALVLATLMRACFGAYNPSKL